MEGCLACLTKVGIPEDNPTWAKVALALELPEPAVPYSPMILPSFDEEKYMNQSEEDKDAVNAVGDLIN